MERRRAQSLEGQRTHVDTAADTSSNYWYGSRDREIRAHVFQRAFNFFFLFSISLSRVDARPPLLSAFLSFVYFTISNRLPVVLLPPANPYIEGRPFEVLVESKLRGTSRDRKKKKKKFLFQTIVFCHLNRNHYSLVVDNVPPFFHLANLQSPSTHKQHTHC